MPRKLQTYQWRSYFMQDYCSGHIIVTSDSLESAKAKVMEWFENEVKALRADFQKDGTVWSDYFNLSIDEEDLEENIEQKRVSIMKDLEEAPEIGQEVILIRGSS